MPEARYENIIVEPSDFQKEMVEELSERAHKVHARLVEPREDNMLKITTDGRKIIDKILVYNEKEIEIVWKDAFGEQNF